MIYTKISLEEILDWLRINLDEKRFKHSTGTAQYAKNLAQKLCMDGEKAYIAGLLHDCAKCFADEKMLEILDKCSEVSADERASYKTWHAPVSAYVAQKTFGVEDKEILSAIRWHTVGKIGMTDFEKIIFLSDKAEFSTRKDEYAQPVRDALDQGNLDAAMLICYKQTIKSLVDRNFKIGSTAVSMYNYLQDIVN